MMSKERLEEIKKRYGSATIVVFEGIDTVSADIQDLNWLIEQAERVEELEEDSKDAKFAIDMLQAENQRYREVIKKAIDDLENECLWDALVALKELEDE